jgi:hypothetical protein
MWLSVGSSSSLIDDMGHVGMFSGVYRPPTLPERPHLPPDDKEGGVKGRLGE